MEGGLRNSNNKIKSISLRSLGREVISNVLGIQPRGDQNRFDFVGGNCRGNRKRGVIVALNTTMSCKKQ